MTKKIRTYSSKLALSDFTARLSAKWRLRTLPTAPEAPAKQTERHAAMEAILAQLVSYPTVTGNTEAIHDAFGYIEAYLTERGMYCKRIEHDSTESLIATTRRTKKPKLFLAGHLDVVSGPSRMFTLREEAGKFYGRGVLDMKCSIAAFMQVVDSLSGDLKAYDFGLMISSDEEAGGDAGVGYLADQGYLADVCVIPDGGDDWQVQTHAKGYLFLSLAAEGKATHASRPWDGKSAIEMMMGALQDIKALFPKPTPETDTFNFGKISGGNTINQIAGHAEALVDVRVINEARKAALLRSIEDICERHNVQLTLVSQGVTVEVDITEPHIADFVSIVSDVTGLNITGSRTMGTSDLRFLIAKGIPCISYYPLGGGHHSADEWLDKTAFHQSYDILMRYVAQQTATGKKGKP